MITAITLKSCCYKPNIDMTLTTRCNSTDRIASSNTNGQFTTKGIKKTTQYLCVLLGMLGLVSCGSTPKSVNKIITKPAPISQAEQNYQKTGADLMRKAELAGGTDKLTFLLEAAQQYQSQDCTKSKLISSSIEPHLSTTSQRIQARVLIAECLFQEQKYQQTSRIIENLATTPLPSELKQRIELLNASLSVVSEQYWEAAATLASSSTFTYQVASESWHLLSQLDTDMLQTKLQNTNAAKSAVERLSWQRLHTTAQLILSLRQFAQQPENLTIAVDEWRNRNANHPLAAQLPQSVINSMASVPFTPTQIAVLLPLSGQLKAQGQSLKEGIVAAFFNEKLKQVSAANPKPIPELVFVDSHGNKDDIATQIANADFVLGPLIKTKIEALADVINAPSLALNFIAPPTILSQQNNVAAQLLSINSGMQELSATGNTSGHNFQEGTIAIVGSNRPVIQNSTLDDRQENPRTLQLTGEKVATQFYFALSPEDEAIQIARHLKQQGITYPVVVQADNRAASRMNKAFTQEWSNMGMSPLETITVTDAKSMRNGVSELLGVAQSKNNVKQIQSLVNAEVHSFERNRRDADAVVIFANATETELINPIIESSISPFAKIIPVFASSRSYSNNRSMNSLRDLRNLRFTDMPWMLPDHNQQKLQNALATLWDRRSDSHYRLFAMGYDAFNVISHLRPLQQIEQYRFSGLTGDIYMDEQRQLRRILPWGQIQDDKVVTLPKS